MENTAMICNNCQTKTVQFHIETDSYICSNCNKIFTTATVPKKTGRPSIYTPELALAICERLAEGESLVSICRDDTMPSYATVKTWELTKEEFLAISLRAREIGCHKMAEDCLQIADDGSNDTYTIEGDDGTVYTKTNTDVIQRSRLRIDTRMRLIGKWLPKIYGDKIETTHKGDPNAPVALVLNGSDVHG